MRPLGSSAAVLLLGVSACVCGAAAPPPYLDDLALIPADARGFLSVRVADLWNSPAVRKGLAEAKDRDPKCESPAARLGREFGLKPDEVERVSAVHSAERLTWAAVRTLAPYDRGKILGRLTGAKLSAHRGQHYHSGTDRWGRSVSVWFAGPRLLVAGPEGGVKRCIELSAAPVAEGPLRPVISLCDRRHHVVAGLNGAALDLPRGNLLVSWLTPFRLAWATADAGRTVNLSINAQAADAAQAARLRRNAKPCYLLGTEFLTTVVDGEIVSGLLSLMGGAEAQQEGTQVTLRSSTDATHLISDLVLLGCGSTFREQWLLAQVRSPFGMHIVEKGREFYWHRPAAGRWASIRLVHGFVMQAKQFVEDELCDIPLAYYTRSGPVGQVFRAYNTDPRRAFAVVDLGAGTMACYGLPGQTVDFYERDRELVRICFDTDEHFTYVEDAARRGVNAHLILGDARETLGRAADATRLKPLRARKGGREPKREYGPPLRAGFRYRLIVVDAFSPDSIPGHLTTKLTREAVKGYFGRLEEDGIVMVHITNRYFDLQPVLANVADDLGLAGYHLSDEEERVGGSQSHWVALARKPEHMAKLLTAPRWSRDPGQFELLAVAGLPAGNSPALLGLAGMGLAGRAVADAQARKAHEEEGRPGDPGLVRTGWRPLETTAELRRLAADGPKEISAIEGRIAGLRKELGKSAGDPVRKAWLDERIAALSSSRDELRRAVGRAPESIRRNARVGVWTDRSSDLIELFFKSLTRAGTSTPPD